MSTEARVIDENKVTIVNPDSVPTSLQSFVAATDAEWDELYRIIQIQKTEVRNIKLKGYK